MPLSGALLADFSSFQKASSDAVVKLVEFQAGSERVATSLNKMADSFSGRKIVADATLMAEVFERAGGASSFTTAQLERMGAVGAEAAAKLTALGKDVPPGIQAIADAAKHTSDSFGEWTSQFNIKDAIENPLGTAKEGMLAFAETLGPTGIALAAGGVAAAAMGGALFELATRAASVGAGLDDMADKTGLSVPALSKLSNAAQVIGADMGSLTDVVFKLQKGIGENTDTFQAGLAKMGLSTADLKAAGPDQYLGLITEGLKGISDSGTRAAAGTEVLGKGYKDVAHALMDLDAGIEKTADLTPWTAEQARAAEEFEQQIGSIETHVRAAGTAIGNDLIPVISLGVSALAFFGQGAADAAKELIDLFGVIPALKGALGETALAEQSAGAVTDTATHLWAQQGATAESVATQMLTLGYSQQHVAEQTGLSAAAVKAMAGEQALAKVEADAYADVWGRVNAALALGTPTLDGVSVSTQGLVADMRAAGVSVADMAAATDLSVGQIKLLETTQDAAAAATKKLADELQRAADEAVKKFAGAVLEVESAGATAAQTLDTMDGAVVESIKSSLAAGVSQAALATYFDLTAAQVKAVSTEMAANKKLTDEQTAAAQKLANAMGELSNAGQGWKTTLETIDGEVVEAIAFYLKAGVSQGALAEAYGLTAAQIAAVVARLRELADAQNHANDEANKGAKGAGEFGESWGKGFTETTAGVITWRTAMSEASAAIDGDLAKNIKNVQTLAGEYISAADAKKAFDSGGSQDVTTQNFRSIVDSLNTDGGLLPSGGLFNVEGAEHMAGLGYSFAEIVKYLTSGQHGPIPPPQGPRIPGFASGVENFGGGLAMVGERGPELVNLPAGSDVIPMGQGGGTTINNTNHIYVNGTAADVARQVAAEIMKTAKLGRKFGSA